MVPLGDKRLQNLGDLEFVISRSFKVKFNGAVGLRIYDFILVCNSYYMSKSHRLGVIATGKSFSYLLSLGPNFDTHTHTLLSRDEFFQNLIASSLGPREASH